MFDKIIDVLIQTFTFFIPFTVIPVYARAVVLRLGNFHRELDPGFHWVIPFGIDEVHSDNVVPRTDALGEQVLTTADGKTVGVCAVLTSQIRDIQKALLEVEGVDEALADSAVGVIGEMVNKATLVEVYSSEFADLVTKAVRRNAFKYGIEVLRVQFKDRAPIRNFRVHNG